MNLNIKDFIAIELVKKRVKEQPEEVSEVLYKIHKLLLKLPKNIMETRL